MSAILGVAAVIATDGAVVVVDLGVAEGAGVESSSISMSSSVSEGGINSFLADLPAGMVPVPVLPGPGPR